MISAKYIVKNEADNIVKSLNSVKDKVNEIIIVDTGSTDKTIEVIDKWYSSLGIINKPMLKVFSHEWNGFADARNFAISKCTGDWIVVVDGDETLETIEIPDADYGVCKVVNVIGDLDLEPFDAIRLFKNIPQIKYEGIRQAIPDKSLKGLKGAYCNTKIKHYGYEMTKDEMRIKTIKNLEDHLKQFAEEPDNITVEYYISHCYRYLGEHRNAIDYGVLALDRPIVHTMKAMLCISLYMDYSALGIPHIANRWLLKSLQYEPMQILARALLVQILDNEGNTLLADEHFKIMQKIINDKNSKLPNDYYYSEAELINLRSKNNAI